MGQLQVVPFLNSILQDKHGSTAEYYADRFHNFETLNVIQVRNHATQSRVADPAF